MAIIETSTISTTICGECLSPSDDLVKDWQDAFLCTDCAANYYIGCNVCLRHIPLDEVKSQQNESVLCPECVKNTTTGTAVEISEEEVQQLVMEYLTLYAEEKRLTDRLEEIKNKLKIAAESKERISGGVTLQSDQGAVKCSYRSSVKCVTEEVSNLEKVLDEKVFKDIFIRKISFSADKNKLEDFLRNEQVPEDLRRAMHDAVEITETVTLTVSRPKK